MSETVAIIPARGGSKGIPNKNLTLLGGKPLISYAIDAAQVAAEVSRVVVTTDCERIAGLARTLEAQVVSRPAEIATDTASSEAALLHALEVLEAGGAAPETLVFLQCTSPLTQAFHIDEAVRQFRREGAQSCLAVTPVHSFLWRQGPDGAVGINHDKRVRPMRQEREPEFLETGAIYVMDVGGFKQARHRFFGKTALYSMAPEYVQEIDEPADLMLAADRLRALGTR